MILSNFTASSFKYEYNLFFNENHFLLNPLMCLKSNKNSLNKETLANEREF